MRRGSIIWRPVSSALLLVLVGLAPPARALDDTRRSALTNLVRQDCGSCHGLTLGGGLGRPLVPETLEGTDSRAIADVILDGVSGTPMPPWRGLLSDAEALWIADRLKEGFPK